MSKKEFAAFAENMTDDELSAVTGVGAVLRDFGTAMEKEWQSRFGRLLSAEERKENDGKPNVVANPVVDIEVPGVISLMLRPGGDNNKTRGNGYANDVGLSDKVKTGNVPPTLLAEILVDKMATMLGGNIAAKALVDLQEALRACMKVEDGSFTFDKKAAPPLQHPVEVAEWMAALKTEFVGTTAGATHVSMEVVPISVSPHEEAVGVTEGGEHIPVPAFDGASEDLGITGGQSPSDADEGGSPVDVETQGVIW